MSWQHIYPEKDSSPHCLNYVLCSCKPKIDWNNHLIIHNSFDNREIVEAAENILKEDNNEN